MNEPQIVWVELSKDIQAEVQWEAWDGSGCYPCDEQEGGW